MSVLDTAWGWLSERAEEDCEEARAECESFCEWIWDQAEDRYNAVADYFRGDGEDGD